MLDHEQPPGAQQAVRTGDDRAGTSSPSGPPPHRASGGSCSRTSGSRISRVRRDVRRVRHDDVDLAVELGNGVGGIAEAQVDVRGRRGCARPRRAPRATARRHGPAPPAPRGPPRRRWPPTRCTGRRRRAGDGRRPRVGVPRRARPRPRPRSPGAGRTPRAPPRGSADGSATPRSGAAAARAPRARRRARRRRRPRPSCRCRRATRSAGRTPRTCAASSRASCSGDGTPALARMPVASAEHRRRSDGSLTGGRALRSASTSAWTTPSRSPSRTCRGCRPCSRPGGR